jgi:hypothetical protein
VKSVRAEFLPSLSFDYFWGIDANQFAVHDPEGRNNPGSVAQAQLNIPVWNWGAAKSRVAQSQLRLQQARNDLTLTPRQLLADLNQFYLEARSASSQIASLRRSLELSALVVFTILLIGGAYECYDHTGSDLLPAMDEAGFIVDYLTPAGASLPGTNRDAGGRELLHAGERRLRPIMMTALATVAGMIPLALHWGAGSQMLQPLAVAMIVGIFASMVPW